MLMVLVGVAPARPLPAEHACLPNGPASHMPFCNASLPIPERVANLISNLTFKEKAGLMGAGTHRCAFMDAGVERLGIPVYTWAVETNTGADGICLGPGRCQSTFPGATGLAASFNRSVWRSQGEVISTELRVMNNLGGMRNGGPADFIGLNGWGPNINIIRDPRFGRNSELPSEDPVLSGIYAEEVVKAMQVLSANGKCMKMHASLKHYAAYSVEANRQGINEIISTYDLHDTYLAQYEAAFVRGRASGVMCSYNSINGVPMCGNEALLNKRIRVAWNRSDALIVTDCGAVVNMVARLTPSSRRLKNLVQATALSINSGVDLETGPAWTGNPAYSNRSDPAHTLLPRGDLADAVAAGAVNISTVDRALSRSLTARMKLGVFDPPGGITDSCAEFTKLSIQDIGAKNAAHTAALASAAAQSFVLLRNQKNTLPLRAGANIAVLGPHATTRAGLLSSYSGNSWCFAAKYDGQNKNVSCVPTIGESIAQANAAGKTTVVGGTPVNLPCNISSAHQTQQTAGQCEIAQAVAAAKEADVIILCLGTSAQFPDARIANSNTRTMGEGQDRNDTNLPGSQTELADAIFAAGKPVVLVLVNGGIVAIDKYVKRAAAIVEAFFPALQSPALAASLFGLNRWGKLPITYYTSQLPWEMTDMDVATGAGRTYRYFKGGALFEFGDGLSYTTFHHLCSCAAMECSCAVKNAGALAGDEVVMVYDSLSDAIRTAVGKAHPLPIKRLVDFQRLSLAAGASTTLTFTITAEMLRLTTADGSKRSYAGMHNLVFSRGNGNDQIVPITVPPNI